MIFNCDVTCCLKSYKVINETNSCFLDNIKCLAHMSNQKTY